MGDFGFLNTLSGIFAHAEERYPGVIPDLRSAKQLFVGSDYGGEHKGAKYQTVAFFVSDTALCAAWHPLRENVRVKTRLGRRRMAFKNLNDSVRASALEAFLTAANVIPGIVVVFAVHKNVISMFGSGEKIVPRTLDFEPLQSVSTPVAEKLLRVVHLLSLLIAGLSAPGQHVLWVTDDDVIAANADRLRHLASALARVSSHLLRHNLGHLRVATTSQDKGDLSLEDLLAIPDIAAGGIAEVLSVMFPLGAPPNGMAFPRSETASAKARKVMDWFADNTQSLRRMVIAVEETSRPPKIRGTHLRFYGLRDHVHGV